MFILSIILSGKPIVRLINYISEKIIKKIGLSLETDQSKVIKEEFEGAVQLQRQLSKKGENEAEYMSNLLELKNLKVDELMTHRNEILYLDLEDNFKSNLKAINNSTFTRIPLIKNNFNNLIGVIDIRDLLKDSSFNENADNSYLEKNSFQPVFIPQNKLAIKQLIDFKSQREHIALVVDEYGEIQGLILSGNHYYACFVIIINVAPNSRERLVQFSIGRIHRLGP